MTWKKAFPWTVILEEIEKAYIEKALKCVRGNKTQAADLLGINLRSLRYRCNKLEIDVLSD
jgi:two-component system, NtrC family, response regulator PilR